MLIVYYIVVVLLNKVDFNSVYWIWSGKHHKRFYKNFRKFWNQQKIETPTSGTLPFSYFDFWCQFAKHAK